MLINSKRLATQSRLAWDIHAALEALPDDMSGVAQIPALFAALPAVDRYDVFRTLDEKPGRFPRYLGGHWFRILRQCRNHPTHGRALFDAINGRGASAKRA